MLKAKLAAVLCSVFALALLLGATSVWAQPPVPPPLPHGFYGTVTIGGAPAPIGTLISTQVGGVEGGNYTTSVVGHYGNPAELDYLIVQGDIETGATIDFYVNGSKADQTCPFEAGGGPTELDLTSPAPAPTPTPTPTPSPPPAETPTPTPGPPPTETPSPTPGPPPAETPTPAPSPPPAETPTPTPSPGGGSSSVPWAGIGAAVVAVLALGIWFIIRQR